MEGDHLVEPMIIQPPVTEASEVIDNKAPIKRLIIVASVCLLFMIAEVVGGLLANSIAIMTDAGHLLSDLIGFAISVISLYISQRCGYQRAEIYGAILSMILIWGLTIWLAFEAILRILSPVEVDGLIMLITAIFGFVCNIVMFKLLHSHGHAHGGHGCSHGHDHGHKHSHELEPAHGAEHKHGHDHGHKHGHDHAHEHEHDHAHEHAHEHGHDHKHKEHKHKEHKHKEHKEHKDHKHKPNKKLAHSSHLLLKELMTSVRAGQVPEKPKQHENVNVRAALLHVIGDLIQSIGVIIAAIIVYCRPDWNIVDPLCTLLFSIIVVCTTLPIIRECIIELIHGPPKSEISELEKDFAAIHSEISLQEEVEEKQPATAEASPLS
jgi:zinc transporter 2